MTYLKWNLITFFNFPQVLTWVLLCHCLNHRFLFLIHWNFQTCDLQVYCFDTTLVDLNCWTELFFNFSSAKLSQCLPTRQRCKICLQFTQKVLKKVKVNIFAILLCILEALSCEMQNPEGPTILQTPRSFVFYRNETKG